MPYATEGTVIAPGREHASIHPSWPNGITRLAICEDDRRTGSFPWRTTTVDLDRLLTDRLTGVARSEVATVRVWLGTANRAAS